MPPQKRAHNVQGWLVIGIIAIKIKRERKIATGSPRPAWSNLNNLLRRGGYVAPINPLKPTRKGAKINQIKMGASDRVLQFLNVKGLTGGRKGKSIRTFYMEVGISNGSIRPGKGIGSEILSKISGKYPDLNMDWVISGRGAMFGEGISELQGMGELNRLSEAIESLRQQNTDLDNENRDLHRKLLKCMEDKEMLVGEALRKITSSETAV